MIVLVGIALAVSPGLAAAGGAARPAEAALVTRAIELASVVRPAPVAAPAATAFNPAGVDIGLAAIGSGFNKPVLVTHAGDGSGRLFVVEQTGRIRIIKAGVTLAAPFLDLVAALPVGGELGLLGLAFNPLYPARPYFYVYFTDRNHNVVVNRYTVSADPDVANRASGVRVLTIAKPYANHNGGHLAFGPDGYLYIGTGDGGGAGDPGNRAQSLSSPLGKMLRIDINRGSGTRHYSNPSSNPYVGITGLDEIWARGLRNPWRWSFDRSTGQLWIADVGQDNWEEVNRSSATASGPAGRAVNYGWNVMEGRACYKPATGCSKTGKHLPQTVYGHAAAGADNCSVTGGYVYRGSAYPALAGGYLFGDFCSGRIWVISPTATAPLTATLVRDATAVPQLSISSFGEDEAGELYLCDLGGTVYLVTATARL